jgi:preprotein translocase subunit SecY
MKLLMNQLYFLVPIFLSSIILIVLVVRDLQRPDTAVRENRDNNNNDDKMTMYAQIVLSFISSSLIFLYASYFFRSDFNLQHWWMYIIVLLFLVITPFGLVMLRLFVAEGRGVERGLNMFIILSAAATMLYTFGAAGGMALFGK